MDVNKYIVCNFVMSIKRADRDDKKNIKIFLSW